MPATKKYRKDSIVYFEGDFGKEIFLIKSGKMMINYKDVSGESELTDFLGKGEFFGIKSAITGYSREETVTAVEDSEVLTFSSSEIEALVKQTPAVGLKILRSLSYNLRQITKEEKKLVSQNAFEDPGNEMYKMGLFYFNKREYKKAIQLWERFEQFFPKHTEIPDAREMISKSKEAIKTGYHPTVERRGA